MQKFLINIKFILYIIKVYINKINKQFAKQFEKLAIQFFSILKFCRQILIDKFILPQLAPPPTNLATALLPTYATSNKHLR